MIFYVPRVLLLALRWPRRDKAGPHSEVIILSAALYELQGLCGVTMFLSCFTDKYLKTALHEIILFYDRFCCNSNWKQFSVQDDENSNFSCIVYQIKEFYLTIRKKKKQ